MLVEDEDAIVRPLAAALEREGFSVERFRTAEEAIALLPVTNPDLVLLDLGLPGMPGLDACRVIRQSSDVPIVVLTARGEDADRIRGLEAGADDFVVKPFSARELVARLRAVLRRARRAPAAVLRVGELVLDLDRRQVLRSGSEIRLAPREFDLLAHLARRAPGVVDRRELLEQVWDQHWDRSTKTLDVHIAQLRRKLETDPRNPRFLHTVRGVGYRLEDTCAAA